MPVVNFTYGGFTGTLHGADFRISDEKLAYIQSAKLAALTVYHLLKDNAAQARKLMDTFQPVMTPEEYRGYVHQFDSGFIGEPAPF